MPDRRKPLEPVGLDRIVSPWTARFMQEGDTTMVGPPYDILRKCPAPAAVYQFKVRLEDISPMIWRRFLVPNHLTFAAFSDVLLRVVGWMDSHLHEFRIGKGRIGIPDVDGYEPMLPEEQYRLRDVKKQPLSRLVYLYDFGDSWRHDLTLEKSLPAGSWQHPHCLEGARACPPEDCGGISGYARLLKVLDDPEDPEHEEMRIWAGEDYDPDFFDARAVNRALNRMKRAR